MLLLRLIGCLLLLRCRLRLILLIRPFSSGLLLRLRLLSILADGSLLLRLVRCRLGGRGLSRRLFIVIIAAAD